MARWIFTWILLPALTLTAAPPKILTLPHREEQLSNGLRIYLVQYPSQGVVSYQIAVRAGSRNEVEKGKSGFAHFFEHLMFRGTKNRTGKEFGELYAKVGAENNAWTWFDMTDYHGTVATAYLDRILEAEADRFQNLSFDEKALKDEAGAVLGEYNKSVAQPEFQLEETLLATAFQVHPYGHTTMGYQSDILRYTERYRDVWPFFHRYYRPGNVAVILVGDIDLGKHASMVKRYFGDWKDPIGISEATIRSEPAQTAPRFARLVIKKPTQTRITIAYKVPPFSTKNADSATLDLIAALGFATTSEFQKTYRFERKWIDSMDFEPLPMRDAGLWQIQLRLSQLGQSREKELTQGVQDTVKSFSQGSADPGKLAGAKSRFRNAALSTWFSGPEPLANKVAWYTNFEPDLGVLERYFQRIDEITPQDVKTFAVKYLTSKSMTTVVLRGSSGK